MKKQSLPIREAYKMKLSVSVIIVMLTAGPFFLTTVFAGRSYQQNQNVSFFQMLDKNNDGAISQDEFPGSEDHFTQFDKDNDGYLDESELSENKPLKKNSDGSKKHLQRLDKDNDGVISQDEFPGPDDHFTRFDKNNDGFLDESELPEKKPLKKNSGGSKKHLQRLDKNDDGKISQEEFPGPDDHFVEFDQNDDGFLDETELPAGPPPGKKHNSRQKR